jgi:thioredoxin 1
MAAFEKLTDATFAEEVERAEGIVAVDFWAAWCAPCRVSAKVLEEVAPEYESRVRVKTIDTDLNPATATRYGVRSLPTLIFFKDGKVVDQLVGAVPREALRKRFEAVAS